MNNEFLARVKDLQESDYDDTRELMHGVLKTVETGFQVGADGKVNLNDTIFIIPILGPVQAAIDNGSDASRELGLWTNEDFEREWADASATFDLKDNEDEHDILGITKGIFHVFRLISRGRAERQAAA